MKQKIFLTANFFLLVGLVSFSQPNDGSFKPPSLQERLKRTNEIIQQAIMPTADQKAAIEKAFTTFFTAADKLIQDNPPPPPPANVKASMEKFEQERDGNIKKVLTESQYKLYLETIKKIRPAESGMPSNRKGQPSIYK
jgi:hypothetical protein